MKKKNSAQSAMSELLSKVSETQLNIEPPKPAEKRNKIETLNFSEAAPNGRTTSQHRPDKISYSGRFPTNRRINAQPVQNANIPADGKKADTRRFTAVKTAAPASAAQQNARTQTVPLRRPAPQAVRRSSGVALRDTYQNISAKAENVRRGVGQVISTHAEAGKRAVRFSARVARVAVIAAILVCLCTGIVSAVLILGPDDNSIKEVAAIGERYVPTEAAASDSDAEAASELTVKDASVMADAATADGNGRYTVTFTFYKKDSVTCTTASRTVGELVAMLDIMLTDDETLRCNLDQKITADTIVNVDAVSYGTDYSYEAIAYETEYIDVQTIPRGSTQVYQYGQNGTKTIEYTITYVNGAETERVQANEYTSTSPTKCIVYRGVGGTVDIGGVSRSYSYYIDCSSTVYEAGGTTATGRAADESVIAVDPSVIPYGSSCYISGYYSGVRTAADTGGSINGNIVDICFSADNPMLYSYGRRSARVYILG